MNSFSWFRVFALAETVSYLGLLAAVVAKRGFGQPAAVSAIGPIHGVLFLAYFVVVIFLREEQRWSPRETGAVLLAAVIPFGGYLAERRLARSGRPSAVTDGVQS
mgnify:CR=1 FL=1